LLSDFSTFVYRLHKLPAGYTVTFDEVKVALNNKTVGIAGCGGLGSNCAVALARSGIGELIIADFDVIETSNLNRQYYFTDQVGRQKASTLKDNIARINPAVKVTACDFRLTSENVTSVFARCDVIVEAFDLAGEKEMLIGTVLNDLPETPLVIGLGMAGWGKNETIHCRRVDNLYICGDEVSEIAPDLPPLAPRVGIVACMQANTVLEILLKGI
jgi:sulfur carrier protein ThiS adenylyltransferase